MTRLPAFWQLEPPLHTECRAAKCPIFLNDANNMPLGAAAFEAAEVNMLVTEAADAHAFCAYLKEMDVRTAAAWLIVHRMDADEWTVPQVIAESANVKLAQEVHLFPGCPALVQCKELMHDKQPLFHLTPEYELDTTGTQLIGGESAILPRHAILLPRTLSPRGTCVCGEAIITRNDL
jgi:hypothetical protein